MDAERVEGRDLGTLGMNLAYAQQDYFFGMENIFQQQKTADIQAASQRIGKPSGAGLALGLAGAAIGGYQAYTSLKAPPATVPTPTTPTTGYGGSLTFNPQAYQLPRLA